MKELKHIENGLMMLSDSSVNYHYSQLAALAIEITESEKRQILNI